MVGGGRSKREVMCVCTWLIHFTVQRKLTQHCEAIILQIKKKERQCGWLQRKKLRSVENYNTTYGYQIFVLFIVFEVLLHNCKPNWILNSSSFLKYLVKTLQTNVSNFLPPFWFGITKNKDFPWTPLEGTIPSLPHYSDLNFGSTSSNYKRLIQTLGIAHQLEI